MNKPFQRRINKSIFGTTEILLVVLSGFLFFLSVLFYFFFVAPKSSDLEGLENEKNRLEGELSSESLKYQNYTNIENQIEKLVRSAEDFELRFLPVADFGRTLLYQRLNYLIQIHGLINTSGPDYSSLEVAGQKSEERGRDRYRSLFPGVYVSMTVEGSYRNLRRFIRDLEAGEQFFIITAIELQPSDNSNAVQSEAQTAVDQRADQPFARPSDFEKNVQTTTQRGKIIGETVSLKIELVAYFRRGVEILK